ncbi:MAG: hypothetical protein HKN73_05945, partial [Gemmatimonadetes bacterium]|nr:hypothetical protein [Gemmatimonadota bacterium]
MTTTVAPESGALARSGPEDGVGRESGRTLMLSLASALREASRMSPRRTALGLLTRVVGEHLATHGYLEIRRVAEALFLNGRKMQQDLDNYAAFAHVLGT